MALAALVDGAAAGDGRVVVVQGPPGIGKSALVQWLAGRAEDDGASIRLVRGTRLGAGTPFGIARWLFTEDVRRDPDLLSAGWARRAAPVFAAASGPGDTGALVEGLVALVADIAHRTGPLILAVDDAQWADPPSLALLLELAQRGREVGAGLVLTLTSGLGSPAPAALTEIAALPVATIITPAPLSTDGVQQLLDGDGDGVVARRIHAASGGNPLLVGAMVEARRRTGEDSPAVPESLTALVLARLTDLPDDTQALALAAAVLGEAPLHRAARLAGLDPQSARPAADALTARHVLASGEPLRFSQPIVAEALLGTVPPFSLADMHRRAAELLGADGATREHVAAHLLHSAPAGDPWVATMLVDASARALDRGDPGAAVQLLRRAVQEPPPADARGSMLVALARAETIAGSPSAIDAFRRALDHVPDGEDRLEAWHGLSRRLYLRGDYRLAATAAAQGRAELAPGDPAGERLLAAELSAASIVPDLAPDAVARTAALIAGQTPSDPALLAAMVGQQGWTADRMDLIPERALLAVAADPLVDPSSGGIALSFIAGALNWVDEPLVARRILDAGLDRVAEIGDPLAEVSLRSCRAWSCIYIGDLAAARRDLDAVSSLNALGWAAGEGLAGPPRIMVALEAGDIEAARVALTNTPAVLNPGLPWFEGAVAHAAGDAAGALEAFERAGEVLEGMLGLRNPTVLPWRSSAALAAAGLGRDELARRHAFAELAAAESAGIARSLGNALAVAGWVSGELEMMERGVQVLETSPSRLTLARALLMLGIGYRRARRLRDARAPLGRALDMCEQMGATHLAQRALLELRTAGARPRQRARSGLRALTPREREVATLAARGLTTRQVSAELFLTAKTVETHLTNVFRKLRISSRGELAPLLTGGDSESDQPLRPADTPAP